jgi:hypothetical protein
MDLGTISAAVSSLKVATDLTKGILSISKQVAVQEKVIELQGVILSINSELLSIQNEYSQALSKMNSLEQKIKEYDDWKIIQEKYELKKVGIDIFVYSLKEDTNKEPSHWLCAKCFNEKKVSILQRRFPDLGIFDCHTCKNQIDIRSMPPKKRNDDNGPKSWMSV